VVEEEEEEDFVSLVVVGLVLDSSLAIEVTIFASSAVIMAAMFALEWESKRSYLRRLRNVVTGLAQSNHKLAKDRMRAGG